VFGDVRRGLRIRSVFPLLTLSAVALATAGVGGAAVQENPTTVTVDSVLRFQLERRDRAVRLHGLPSAPLYARSLR